MTFLRGARFLTGRQSDFQNGEVERPSMLRFAFQGISGQGGKSAAISISSSGGPGANNRPQSNCVSLDVALSFNIATSMNMALDRAAESLFCGWYVSIFGEISHLFWSRSVLEAWQLLKNEKGFEKTSTNKICQIESWPRHCSPICSQRGKGRGQSYVHITA